MDEHEHFLIWNILLLIDAGIIYTLGRSGAVGTFGFDLCLLAGAMMGVGVVFAASTICALGDAYGFVSGD